MSLTVKEFPIDLDDRIKAYLTSQGEKWDTDKHFIYITHSELSSKLVFDTWLYKCPPPDYSHLKLTDVKVKLKKGNGN